MKDTYRATLWRDRPWWRGGGQAAVIAGEQVWLDLHDEDEATGTVAMLIARSGGSIADAAQYSAELADLATGEVITRLSCSTADLASVRNGPWSAPAPGSSVSLDNVSDEVLVREVARRLRSR